MRLTDLVASFPSNENLAILPLPPGFREVDPNVFEGPARKVGPDAFVGMVRVRLGAVDPNDEAHSCDALGCSSVGEHVIERTVLPSPSALPRSAEDYAMGRFNG